MIDATMGIARRRHVGLLPSSGSTTLLHTVNILG